MKPEGKEKNQNGISHVRDLKKLWGNSKCPKVIKMKSRRTDLQ